MTTRQLSRTFALAAGLLLAGPIASAATLQLNSTVHSNTGGVFAVTQTGDLDVSHYHSSALYAATSGDKGIGFGSFCLEYNEPFDPGDIFDYTIASYANAGGVGGQTSPGQDPISIGTAWLYMQFATGNLGAVASSAGKSFSYSSTLDLRNLQRAFWFLEDEGQGSLTNNYVQLVIGNFATLDVAKEHANGAYGVAVLNITKDSDLRQSQLYFGGVPQQVPDEATTGLLLLGAFAVLASARRLCVNKQI